MPITPKPNELKYLQDAEARRRQNASISMINYMREARAPVIDEVNRIYRTYGVEDSNGRETIDTIRYNKRRQEVTVSTIAAIATILIRRDNFSSRSVKNAYAAAWYESSWVTGNLIGNVRDLGDPKKRLLKAAFESVNSKLSTPADLAIDRRRFIRRVTDTIVRGANNGRTIKELTKEIDKVFGFRNGAGQLVIYPEPTAQQLAKMPKFIKQRPDGRLVFLTQDGKEIPIKFTTTPRIPTGGEIYNSVRIVRTELHRMQGAAAIDAMKNGQANGIDERIQKLTVFDAATREQSAQMDGQISDKEGNFKYPGIPTPRPLGNSGNPAFDINDRGIPAPIILDFDEDLQAEVNAAEESGDTVTYNWFTDYTRANGIKIDEYGPIYAPGF